jgi:LysM repeat protein
VVPGRIVKPNKEGAPAMSKKIFSILLVFIILALALSSCTRIASFSPLANQVPTVDSLADLPIIIQAPQIQDPLSITQTAIAMIAQATQPAIIITVTAEPSGIGVEEAEPTPIPPTSTAVPPTAVPSRPETYTLKYGEWPICIARRYDLDLSNFLAANNLNMQSGSLTGTVLKIPQTGNWSSSNGTRSWHAHPAQYTIQPGDNIYSIACFYGDIEPDAILSANDLSGSYTLNVGQVLQIP